MAYPRSFIDEVRRSVDSLQVIGEAVALKRRGSRWVGLCPFHNEKTPSFTVNAEEGLWHCFGCGEGGDIFRFVMDQEALGFSDAVRSLAERAGMEVPASEAMRGQQNQRAIDRRRVIAVLGAADAFYRDQLSGEPGARAREFLVERGFEDDIVRRFGLGFAPDSWDAAQQHLTSQGFDEEELEVAGLVKRRDTGKGTYDRLRHRVVFPIRDLRGQTIAFGGRVIDEGEPKYLNSPETPTFNKGRTLYGLYEGRDAIGETGFALLVEGYFDLLACAQYGLRNTVAPLGTAFSQDHAKLLARFTRKAVVAFDGDTAGQAAAERTVGIFLGQGFQVNVVRLPAGHDPDSYLHAEGIDGFRAAFKRSDSGLEFTIGRAGERNDLETPRGKAEALSSLLEFVVPITDRVERAEWIGRLSERLDIEPRLIEAAERDVRARARSRREPAYDEGPPQQREASWRADLDQVSLAERDLLRAVLEHPEWRVPLAGICSPEAIRDARVRALLVAVAACDGEGVAVDAANVLARCELPGCEPLLSRLRLEDGLPLDWDAARNCALGIHDDSLRRRLREMTNDIREALAAGDHERFSELNREKVSLAQQIGSA
jgi:DNA primase